MKAYRITAIDRRDNDGNFLDKCLVVAESFDEARAAAMEYFKSQWGEATQVELSSIDTLSEYVVMGATKLAQ